jgi:hypothetical protein
VEDGLVERGLCSTDARGAEAVLTPLGLERLRKAAPTHLRGIQEYFLASIPEADLTVVERAMRGISEGLPGGPFARGARAGRGTEACGDGEAASPPGPAWLDAIAPVEGIGAAPRLRR